MTTDNTGFDELEEETFGADDLEPEKESNQLGFPSGALKITKGRKKRTELLLIYGQSKVGKTELVSLIPDALFIDLELGSHQLDVARLGDDVKWTFPLVRQAVQAAAETDAKVVCLDSATKAQDLCAEWICEGTNHRTLDSFKWGEGRSQLYTEMLGLLRDLEDLRNAGKHVLVIAHDTVVQASNTWGEDFLRHVPRLYEGSKGKNSVRNRFCETADGILFIGHPVKVEDGKVADDSVPRRIYASSSQTHMGGLRGLDMDLPYRKGDKKIWKKIFGRK